MTMITDSKGKNWTPNDDRSVWSNGEMSVVVNTDWSDEQVASALEAATDPAMEQPAKTDAERIAELEAQVKALLSKLS